MRVLFFVSTFGLAESKLAENATRRGHQVDVLDVQSLRWLRRSAPQERRGLHRWMSYWPLRASRNQIARVVREIVESGDYEGYFALSLPAAGFAARYLEEEFVPLLWRGDLDFSAARVQLTQDFHDLTTAVDRIFLQDENEFDKALSKGSRSAHLLHRPQPLSSQSAGQLLDHGATAPRVALLHPERVAPERRDAQADMLRPVVEGQGGTLSLLSASSLFRTRDFLRKRDVRDTAAMRLDGFTHVVLTGTSRDHETAADLLLNSGDGGRLLVEDTIGMRAWARSRGMDNTGRGARLGGLLHRMLSDATSAEPAGQTGSDSSPEHDLLESYLQAMRPRIARDHEQLELLEETGPLDVFFSTSPLEDRTDGARPQRVRNMAEAMDLSGHAVRLYSTPSVFARRAALIGRLLESGRPAGMLYGENSTSPIPFVDIVEQLAELARTMREHGGTSAWFVRDLHWLDDIDGYLDDPERRHQMQRDGLHELREIGAAMDVLAAPCAESGEGFNALLARHGEPTRQWYPLPPAVAPQNMTDAVLDSSTAEDECTTLLYAGGVGSVYGLDEYLSALSGLQGDFHLDFVVRAAEVELLHIMLERHGLDGHPGLRILTAPLEWYVPRTRRCIGAVLLGGEYARFSFPYKTVSMVERGYPVLCFEDMAIADFVRENQIGTVCARTPAAVRQGIVELIDFDSSRLQNARHEETWAARIHGLRAHLADTVARGTAVV
ncbi:hypothetical protein ACWG8W_13250 [Citricoccus zhacaiensis]